ncbi:MAG: hypothetical protein HYZ75_14160 [Elusimicrobia bacterium]|nr:hypothetical protein [Elusimicrobiota bacterium]
MPVDWTGAGDGSSWSDPANWSPPGVPDAASEVVISSPLVVASSSIPVTAASLDLGAAATAQLQLATGTLVVGLLRVRAGSNLLFLSTQTARAGTFQVDAGGLVDQFGPVSQATTAVTIAAEVFTLAAGATVQAGGRGFVGGVAASGGSGPGPGGAGTGGTGGGGGGHGGAGGGGGLSVNGGAAYGSRSLPTTMGSGGGGGLAPCTGGAGGGVVRILASTATLDGTILADGAGGSGGCTQAGGAGAGGSILIEAVSVLGGGSLFARGGTGGAGGAGRGGGGGGGGRVAMLSTGLNLSAVTVSSASGAGGPAANSGAGGAAGSAFVDPKVWTGAGAVDCKDPGNWVANIAPQASENVVFGSTAPLKSCAWDFTPLAVGSLTMEPGYQGILSWNTLLSSVSGSFVMRGGTLTVTNVDLRVGGDFTQTGGGFALTAGSVTLAGAARTLSVLSSSRFNHLVVENGGSVTAASTLTVGGNLTVRPTGILTLSSGTFLRTTGFLTQLGTVSAPGSFVVFESTPGVLQSRWNEYGSLRVSSPTQVFLLPGVGPTAAIRGDLELEAGAALVGLVSRLELTGNWSSSGSFSAGAGTVAFMGSAPQAILAGGASFNHLDMASAGGVFWAAPVTAVGGVTFSSGSTDLGSATHTVLGFWTTAGGDFHGSSGALVLAGSSRQSVMGATNSVFGRLVSSNPAGVLLARDAAFDGGLELVRGVLDISSRTVRLRGRLARLGAPAVAVSSSNIILDGGGVQSLALGGAALQSLTVTNSSGGARLDEPLVIYGTFTVAAGAVFDGALSSLTLSGAAPGWNTAGAVYLSSSAHRVLWQSPAPGRVLVADGSTVAARVDITGVARLAGRLYVAGGALQAFSSGTLDGRGATVTFRGASELILSTGSAYLHDAGSWLVYEGSGSERGLGLSTGPVRNVLLAPSDPAASFRFAALGVDGSLVAAAGTARVVDSVRLSLRGDLRSTGGVFDFSSSPRSTLSLSGSAHQVLAPGPSDAFAFVELAGSSSAALAPGTLLRVRRGLSLASGRLEGSDARLELDGDWTGSGGTFAAQGSTVSFSSSSIQRYRDSIHQAFNGLSAGPGPRFFTASFDAAVLSATQPAAALSLSTSGLHALGEFRVNGVSTATLAVVESAAAGTPAALSAAVSTVTAALLRDLDLSTGPLVFANDGRSFDGGGNAGVEFRPGLLVLVPGETFVSGAGRGGAAVFETAGTTFTVTVRAVSDRFQPVHTASMSVALRTGDPFDAEPSTAMTAGAAFFPAMLRQAEPAPLSVQVTAAGSAAAVAGSTVAVLPAAFGTLQVLLPGESPRPGGPSGRTGVAEFQLVGVPFSVVVRAADAFGNLIATVTDSVALQPVAGASVTLPAPAALSAGSATLGGLVIFTTGTFRVPAVDVDSAAIAGVESSTVAVFSFSASSPSLSYGVPDGALVGTLGGTVNGRAADGVAVVDVGVALREVQSDLWLDEAGAFSSTAPVMRSASVVPFRGRDVAWEVPFSDALLSSGRAYEVFLRALNPTDLDTVLSSTITFDRGILQFSPGDGEGTAAAAPASTAACQAVVATVTFTAGPSGLGAGGAVALRAPSGWTAPLGISTAVPPPLGYVTIVSTSLAWTVAGSSEVLFAPPSIGSVTLGADWVALRLSSAAANPVRPGETVSFFYHGFPPARAAGRHLLELRSRAGGAGTLVSLTTAPALILSAGPPRGLEFSDRSPLALGPLQTAPTMFLDLTDGCGNAAAAAAPLVVPLSAGQPAAAGFERDVTAAFFLAGGAGTGSVTILAGASRSAGFYVLSSTAGVDSEFLRATATLAGAVVEAQRLVLVRASSVAPSGVSIDSGTLTPGATSAVLVPGSAGARAVARFTLADPAVAWDVTAATESGFTAPLFRRSGAGDAAAPLAVAWDGVVCAGVCSFASPGRYPVRVRAAGLPGPALEVRVATSPFVRGSLGAAGAGASVSVEGPGAGYGSAARADAAGAFRVDGLREGGRYSVRASSVQLVYGEARTLSTAAFSVAASTGGGDAGALSLTAPAFVRVSAGLPVLTSIELFGAVRLRAADGSAVASGGLHFPRFGASSDDGAVALGRAASTWTVLAAAPGVYTLELDLPEVGISTSLAVFAATAAVVDVRVDLPRLATATGLVVLPSTQAYGTAVALSALRAGAALPTRFAALFVAAASSGVVPSSGVFKLFGLEPGSWTLSAQAPGFSAASTTLTVPSFADIGDASGAGGPLLSLGVGSVLRGTVTVTGDTRGLAGTGPAPDAAATAGFSVLVDAFEPRLLRRVRTIVRLSTGAAETSAPFEVGGLEPGRWDLRAEVPGFEKSPAGAQTVTVDAAGGAALLAFVAPAAGARLTVVVEPPAVPCLCAADYARLAFVHQPPSGGAEAVAVATALAGASYEFAAASMTLSLAGLAAGPHRWTFLDKLTGRTGLFSLELSPGATAAASVDLAGASRTVSGRVVMTGAVRLSSAAFAVTVSSVPGLAAHAARAAYCLLSSSAARVLSSARVELIPLGPGFPAVAGPLARAGASCAAWNPEPAAPAIAYVGTLSADGAFRIPGVPPGAYLARIPGDMDGSPENGDELAPVAEALSVSADTTLELSVGPGGRVAGSVSLPPGTAGRRPLRVALSDRAGARLRSALVEAEAGAPAGFALDTVPDGEYTLGVSDLGFPPAFAARPRRLTVSGGSAEVGLVPMEAAGAVRARLALERRRADGSAEVSVLDGSDRSLLPAELRIAAVAAPWVDGGFFPAAGSDCDEDGCRRPLFDAQGRVFIQGVLPGLYDVEFVPSPAAGGADLAPAVRSGVRVEAGVSVDLGVVRLRAAAAVSGLLSDAATGAPAAGVAVAARPSVAGAGDSLRRPAARARSGADGRFTVGGLDPETRFYDLVLAARDGVPGDPVPPWEQSVVAAVDVLSTTSLSLPLRSAPYSVSGRAVAAGGEPLFSDSDGAQGQAGARVFLELEGTPPLTGPLGDTVLLASPDGSFTAAGLSAGAYRLTVAARGYAPRVFSVRVTTASVSLGTVLLSRGATLTGTLRRPDGSAPGEDEVRRVFAAAPDLSEVLAGGLVRDAAGRTAGGYRVSGFTPGRTYRLLLIGADDQAFTPPEAAALVFASSAEVRSLDVVFRTPAPRVSAKSRRSGSDFLVEFAVSQPLRARTSADLDASLLLATAAARGSLSQASVSADRRRISAVYTPEVSESSFSLRLAARTAALDPDAADGGEFLAVATAAFFAGLDGSNSTRVSNLTGGTLAIEGDAGRLALPKGTFFADASSSVAVALRRSDELLLGARSLALSGVPAGEAVVRSLRREAAAYPADLLRAMAATPPDVRPSGPYYDVVLSSATSTRLARPATLTLGYTAGQEPTRLNVYWYNEAANAFVLQPDVTGADYQLDAFNRTVSLAVDHFSTFVLFDAAAAVISGNAYGGADLSAYNFPNPFDLSPKTVTPIHGAGPQTVRGTMIRIAVPSGVDGDGRLMVFSAAGERVRTIELGFLQGGKTYYHAWDGANDSGRDAASGLYIGQVKVGGRSAFFKMAVLR